MDPKSTSSSEELARVLLVEDNKGDAELVSDQLLSRRPLLELVHVDRLAPALEALRADGFDAVLLDLGLPDSKGVTSVRRILETRQNVPVVVLTGFNDEQTGSQAVKAGAQDFLAKGAYNGEGLLKSLVYAVERVRWQQQTQEMVAKNVDAMVVISDDGTIRHVNRAAELLFGRGADALVGRSFAHPLQTQAATEIELARTDGGEPRFAEMRVARINWSGAPAHLASLRDVTDLKRAQELERRLMHSDRLASIGQLAAGVAHEINNPTAFMQTNLEVLSEEIAALRTAHARVRDKLVEELGEPAGNVFDAAQASLGYPDGFRDLEEMLADSLAGTRRISGIVKDLSAFSRIERGDIDPVDMNDVVEVACNMAHNEIRHRARLDKKLGTLPPIAADRARLIQVVINLLVNAAHAIRDGSGADDVITVETLVRGDAVVIAVEDTGCGIPAADREKVFEPFFTTKAQGDGTGLGLSISAETVRKHGGELRVESQVGQGTRFEVVLPQQSGLKTTPRPGGRAVGHLPPRRRARILVIEDESMMRRALRRVLEPTHEVVEAGSGAEGLEVLGQNPRFDVILCDLMMPDVDGVAVYEHIEGHHPDLLDRLVFLTGGAFTRRAKEFLSSVHPLIFEKPIASDVLLGVVERLVPAGKRID